MVLDPAEERIKSEFEGVKRTYLPLHSVLRIDEVRKQGVSKITTFEGAQRHAVSRAAVFHAARRCAGPKK